MTRDLPPAFQRALDVVLAELIARSDLVGVLFFGSAARGEARVGSDLDLYALTARDCGGNLGRVLEDVPVEISFGSIDQMTAQVRRERPTVVHAFATGLLLVDHTDGALGALCSEARALWARGPSPLTSDAALRFRFHLTDLVRDLEAMPPRSAATALTGSEAVRLALEALCATERVWMPPMRRVLATLDNQHAELAALVRQCADAGFTGLLAIKVCDLVLDGLGGRLEGYDTTDTSRN